MSGVGDGANVMAVEAKIKDTIKRRGCFRLLGPPILLLYFTNAFSGTVLTDLIVYRTCLVSLNINSTECLTLRTDPGSPEAVDSETKVEPYASTIVMTKTLIESILAAVVSLFIGPWSDRGGRKPVLLAAFGGQILTFAILSLMSIWNTNPWYFVLASIPAYIVGGPPIVALASVCYICDTTAEKNRIWQFTLIDITVFGGYCLGSVTAPLIYKNYGYTHVFGTAVVCLASALAYTWFFIPETVKDTSKESIRGVFKISFLTDLVTTSTVRKRENFQRSVVWLAILTITLNLMVHEGDSRLEFLFTRARLGWNVPHYSYFTVADHLLRTTGLCAVLLCSHLPDTLLATVGLVSALGSAVTRFLAWKDWHMYLAVGIGMFIEIAGAPMRSIVSKFVPATEVGKAFAIITLLQVPSSLVGAPLYAFVYSHYLPPIYPSPMYMITIGFFILLILFVACIEMLIRRTRNESTYIATAREDF